MTKGPFLKQCTQCGVEFKAGSDQALYCSNACGCKAKRSRDKERYRGYYNKYYWKHKDAVQSFNKQWKQDNKELASNHRHTYRAKKKQGHPEDCSQWVLLMTSPLVGKPCFYCGDSSSGYHMDHFIPISLGGSHAPWNLRLACPKCNLVKGWKLPKSTFCEEIFSYGEKSETREKSKETNNAGITGSKVESRKRVKDCKSH